MTATSSHPGLAQLPRRAAWLAAILAVQGLLLWGLRLDEIPLPLPNLDSIATQFGTWQRTGEEPLDAATEALLRPDASLVRGYVQPGNPNAATLFVGYFKSSQPNHPVPHAPNVCLPAAGWKAVYQREISLTDPSGVAFPLNEYVLEKGGQRLVVLYWYQNSFRAWTNAVFSKVYMLPDFLRYRRTDVALVRITTGASSSTLPQEIENLKNFARSVHPQIARALPQNPLR